MAQLPPSGKTSDTNGYTPQINTIGVFQLIAPFTIAPVQYRVVSVQTLQSLVDEGTDALSGIYLANGLTLTDYTNDIINFVNIVTLVNTANNMVLNVPSSYIAGVPIAQPVPYSRFVITADLGELPSDHTVNLLLSEIALITDAHLGVTTDVKLHRVELDKIVSPDEDIVIRAARDLAVTNYSSFHTALTVANDQLTIANTRILYLEEIVKLQNAQLNP